MGAAPGDPFLVDPALMNFFRPGGLNPSIAAGFYLSGQGRLRGPGAGSSEATLPGFNTDCNPAPPHSIHRLRPLRRHGCQLLQRQFGLSRTDRQSAQAFQQPLRIPRFLHLVARHRRFHRSAVHSHAAGQLLPERRPFHVTFRSAPSLRLQRRLPIGQAQRQRLRQQVLQQLDIRSP